MALMVPDVGELAALKCFLNIVAPENLVLKLYANNRSQTETDVDADYVEVSGSGYASVALTPSNWTVTAGEPTVAVQPPITFTFTGAAGNVYGYFVVGATSGTLKWAERFTTGPFDIANVGDQIVVTPRITCD